MDYNESMSEVPVNALTADEIADLHDELQAKLRLDSCYEDTWTVPDDLDF